MSAPEVTAAVERLAKAQFRAYESEYSAVGVTVADFYATARADLATGLDVEEMARVLGQHRIECTGLEGVTCRGCRERGWMSRYAFEQHQVTALRAAILGEES